MKFQKSQVAVTPPCQLHCCRPCCRIVRDLLLRPLARRPPRVSQISMFSRFQQPLMAATRQFSTSGTRQKTVAVMGASGGKSA